MSTARAHPILTLTGLGKNVILFSNIFLTNMVEHVAFAEPTWSLNTVPYSEK
jgi:hypothetical protein